VEKPNTQKRRFSGEKGKKRVFHFRWEKHTSEKKSYRKPTFRNEKVDLISGICVKHEKKEAKTKRLKNEFRGKKGKSGILM